MESIHAQIFSDLNEVIKILESISTNGNLINSIRAAQKIVIAVELIDIESKNKSKQKT